MFKSKLEIVCEEAGLAYIVGLHPYICPPKLMKTTDIIIIFGQRGDLSNMNSLRLVIADVVARRQYEEYIPVKTL
jgi:hypothetical protein